ncbi:bifunctional cobalt-precorrin-7 (C(5))-methyltransferase/cobalt-precorrin-6B (C(15))-methyltransferase [Polycladidibacter hongkongensis]|uniref:bifunctional cobalt-precorrin-7 (C(5))-methyltransferase/cobalt-precorrin-6B (C(15))-methyltransferase n=1 Tax=Polycladidibacter hongkongensis TaxID=1647556 RepID=UPI00083583E6|nr:bifunctional cobalt-precorrin-7 (C(5))-methyltransferase/cobalt-precorrin-6B (C(15))-methyltransferase [Pseudovibrio hongkongensis]
MANLPAPNLPTPWLTIVGIGEDGPAGLSNVARAALENAQHIYGAARHFQLIGNTKAAQHPWPSPFKAGIEALGKRRGSPVVVLATGDPQWFGIGATLSRHIPAEEMLCLPHSSAFSLASAKLGWGLQEVDCLSVHGRPLDALRAALYPGGKLLLLTANGESPAQIADLLVDEGYGRSRLTVLEHLGGPKENLHSDLAEHFTANVADLNIVAVELEAGAFTPCYGRTPGLPDTAFNHDGKLTKQETRAVTLAKLRPLPGQTLWDVGAGCGSIAIEWLRAAPRTIAYALEPDTTRRARALANAAALGVPQLHLLEARAPEGLDALPEPDAIFIGGGLTAPQMIETCSARLKPSGRLVANAVTLEGEAILLSAYQKYGGELSRLAVSRASPVGTLTGWRPLMTVTQWNWTKQ